MVKFKTTDTIFLIIFILYYYYYYYCFILFLIINDTNNLVLEVFKSWRFSQSKVLTLLQVCNWEVNTEFKCFTTGIVMKHNTSALFSQSYLRHLKVSGSLYSRMFFGTTGEIQCCLLPF